MIPHEPVVVDQGRFPQSNLSLGQKTENNSVCQAGRFQGAPEKRGAPSCKVQRRLTKLDEVWRRFLRETEVQRRRGTTSPDPEKNPEPLRGPLGGFLVGIPKEEITPKSL